VPAEKYSSVTEKASFQLVLFSLSLNKFSIKPIYSLPSGVFGYKIDTYSTIGDVYLHTGIAQNSVLWK
jgi:hypothetical protein